MFSTAALAARWLSAEGFAKSTTRLDRTRLISLRDALRGALTADHGNDGHAAMQHLCEVVGARRFAMQATDDGTFVLVCVDSSVDALVGAIASRVVTAVGAGLWTRLKVCQSGQCTVVYWDGSPNGVGRYCSAERCANRARQSALRARRAAPDPRPSPGRPQPSR